MPRVIAEYKSLLDMRTECHMVREIEIGRQRYGTTIYKGIIGSDCGSVFQYLFAPVDCLIATKSGNTAIEVESLRVIAYDVEIVADFAGELSNRDATFLSVGLIGLKILSAERPSISIVALDD